MSGETTFDRDGDSLMQSESSSPSTDKPATPAAQILSSGIVDLSPPSSQGVPLPAEMPTVANSASGANVNGKRPISSIDHTAESQGGVPLSAVASASASTSATNSTAAPSSANPQIKTHGPSGYTWIRLEDEPGYVWKNKKAQDDYTRACDSLVDKNRIVGKKYGDPFAMADRELAIMNASKEQQMQQSA